MAAKAMHTIPLLHRIVETPQQQAFLLEREGGQYFQCSVDRHL